MFSGRRLAGYRERRGFKQHELAARVGVSTSSIRAYERAGVNPSLVVMARLAQALGVRFEDFLRQHEDPDDDYHDARFDLHSD